jgi:hypothetical protein
LLLLIKPGLAGWIVAGLAKTPRDRQTITNTAVHWNEATKSGTSVAFCPPTVTRFNSSGRVTGVPVGEGVDVTERSDVESIRFHDDSAPMMIFVSANHRPINQ